MNSFQAEVEEGVLVNVTGSPVDVLGELGCAELDDTYDEVADFSQGHTPDTPVQPHDGSPRVKHQEEKSCREEELMTLEETASGEVCGFEKCVDSTDVFEDERSSSASCPEIHNHADHAEHEDPDQKSVSDAELADLLKTIQSSE